MLGSAVRAALAQHGYPILQLLRRKPEEVGQLQWTPDAEVPVSNPAPLEDARAAIHLSGANVAARRWTDEYKRTMTQSRVRSTEQLASTLAQLRRPPQVLLVASAIGIYGDRGDEVLRENSQSGRGFLADLCLNWEAAAQPAVRAGIRVVHLRFGVVLGPGEGALGRMLPSFRACLGAQLGNGKQWMSWVSLADAVGAMLFVLEREDVEGPLNVTSPNPVTNREFTQALGRAVGRPAFFSVPAVVLRTMLGQMADEALLASARVEPAKLMAAGYKFRMPQIAEAVRAAVAK